MLRSKQVCPQWDRNDVLSETSQHISGIIHYTTDVIMISPACQDKMDIFWAPARGLDIPKQQNKANIIVDVQYQGTEL